VLIQLNAAASQQPNTAIWFQPTSLPPGDDLEFTSSVDEPPCLPAPAPSVPPRPEPPDFAGMPQAVRAHESNKYYGQLPAKPVEVQAEVVEPGMAEFQTRVNAHEVRVGAVGESVRQMRKQPTRDEYIDGVRAVGDKLRENYIQGQSPRGIVIAARPSPPPQDGHGGWDGAVEPLSG
jgi:hypothetical protein